MAAISVGETGAAPAQVTVTSSVSHFRPAIPNSGPITSLTVNPSREADVLATSETGGVFGSRDSGSTWEREGVPFTRAQGARYFGAASSLACPCAIVTGAPDFEAAAGGGAYFSGAASVGADGRRSWTRLRGVFPAAGPRCMANPGAYEIAVAPDTRQIYIATDCGIAVGTPTFDFRAVDVVGPSSPAMVAIAALGANRLIAGGSNGVWFSADDGGSWSRETTGIGTIAPEDIHALVSDPRGGGRAYAVNSSTDLYQTVDGGRSWRQVTAPRGGGACGGIANIRAVASATSLRLYFGNKCDTKTAEVPLTAEPSQTLTNSSWRPLSPNHGDTRDIVFRVLTQAPYLVSTDGGVHRTGDGSSFAWVGGPQAGLDADQVTEVAGQYQPGRAQPDLYFATQHNDVWAMRGETVVGSQGAEGFGIGIWPRNTGGATSRMIFSTCFSCSNRISDLGLRNAGTWRDAQPQISLPALIAPGRFAQAVIARGATRAGIQVTRNEGMSWRQIAEIRQPLIGLPKVSRATASPVLTQAYVVTTFPSGAMRVGLLRVSDFASGRGALRYGRSNGFGGLGVTQTAFASYEVVAVDPNDPGRIIAADVQNGDMRRTTNGDDWQTIPGLRNLVTRNGRYVFSQPFGPRRQPLVSTISICPYNSSRVLLGTRQGGAYTSWDGGATWRRLDGTDAVIFATSIFWLEGCGSAYVSTYGRGVYRLDMRLTTRTVSPGAPCDPRLCRIRDVFLEAARARIPGSGPIERAVLVSDGAIRSIATRREAKVITITPGSIVTFLGKRPERLVIDVAARGRARGRSIVGAVFMGDKTVAVKRSKRIEFAPVRHNKLGKGLANAPRQPAATLEIVAKARAFGTAEAVLGPDDPLVVHGVLRKRLPLPVALLVDGREVTKFAPGTKTIDFSADEGLGRPGRHHVTLVAVRPDSTKALAVATAVIGFEDERDEIEKSP